MPTIILQRKDTSELSDSYLKVYDIKNLSSIDKEYHQNILRIIKKSILGSNFIYSYIKYDIIFSMLSFISTIKSLFIAGPKLIFKFFKKKLNNEIIDTLEENKIEPKEETWSKYFCDLFSYYFIEIILLIVMSLYYKNKTKKIKKYMEKYTQCAISQENEMIKEKYFCKISGKGNFDIEINQGENLACYKNDEIFFDYVINIPYIMKAKNYLYYKSFLPLEKEIIVLIQNLLKELEIKNNEKFHKYMLMLLALLFGIIIYVFTPDQQNLDIIHYIGIFSFLLYIKIKIFMKNKKQQELLISLLNDSLFKNGYYFYINNDIISIFYLKEVYRNNIALSEITKINEKFLKKYNLI